MRVIVTGGGTGGHVYPALEIAKTLRDRGADVTYVGSLAGQEKQLAPKHGFAFVGVSAAPLVSLRSLRGWRALWLLAKGSATMRTRLRALRPDVVFSTGGYSAAPVVYAARSLGVPYVIHETNSVPGRTNRMFSRKAVAVSCVFERTMTSMPGANLVRTGQPIRRELREAAALRHPEDDRLLVLGGSQGSQFLNENIPAGVRALGEPVRVTHAAGRKLHALMVARSLPSGYEAHPYLELNELMTAYRGATVGIARSGGTLAEFAVFGLPSVLIPLPGSAGDHQLENALEFEAMGAAYVLKQSDFSPEILADHLRSWLHDSAARWKAAEALAAWDRPDASQKIADLVEGAAR